MPRKGNLPSSSSPPLATADSQFFGLLTDLLQEVESLSNQEEVELRAKIQSLGLEVTKVPSKSAHNLDEMEIANELDKLSSKLKDVDDMVSSAMATDPQVMSLLSTTSDLWMPVVTASTTDRKNFTGTVSEENHEVVRKHSK
ncbi:unnamed protein product [Cuscuta epithymum]|uniref:Uncharacterized protein n=1 Tax=Cuscuta epithymum TaxID=186058 RepID=A0AAV0CTT9_9ASTE|nr:unnamed protein product [Cuscuta epithymum]